MGAQPSAAEGGPGPTRLDGPSDGRTGFDDLYRAWYGRLAAQLHAYLGDRAEAEDVVQEAFVRAWDRWATVCRYDDPVTWVRRVAWNLATSRLRRLTVAARALRRQQMPEAIAAPDPNHVALVTALRRLPERHRLAVVLHHLADLPVATVADELGVPKGTVLSWLHRARAQLARHLDEAGASDSTLRRR